MFNFVMVDLVDTRVRRESCKMTQVGQVWDENAAISVQNISAAIRSAEVQKCRSEIVLIHLPPQGHGP